MGNKMNEFNQLRNIVRTGASILGSLEEEDNRKRQQELNRTGNNIDADKNLMESRERAYQQGVHDSSKSGSERFQLKEMTCPNCGATMKPNEVAMATAALGSVDCVYCGSKIVLNDEVKNAEYVHKVDVEKKRTELEERKQKLQEDRLKAQKEHENNKNTLDTIKSVDQGIDKAIKAGKIAIGCFTVGIIFFILIVVLIIWLINR